MSPADGCEQEGPAKGQAARATHPPTTREPAGRTVTLREAESAFYVLRKTEDVANKYIVMEELGSGQVRVYAAPPGQMWASQQGGGGGMQHLDGQGIQRHGRWKLCTNPCKINQTMGGICISFCCCVASYLSRRIHSTICLHGRLQFGIVSVVVDKATGKKYAMKSMSKRRADVAKNQGADIRTEVEILYHLGGHENVVQLIDVYEDKEDIHLIMVCVCVCMCVRALMSSNQLIWGCPVEPQRWLRSTFHARTASWDTKASEP